MDQKPAAIITSGVGTAVAIVFIFWLRVRHGIEVPGEVTAAIGTIVFTGAMLLEEILREVKRIVYCAFDRWLPPRPAAAPAAPTQPQSQPEARP